MAEPGLRARHKVATRALIVRVANRLFLKHGFDGVTIDQIATECGISARTIPRYFPSKEDIALARHRDDLELFKKELVNRTGDVVSCWRQFVVTGAIGVVGTETFLRKYTAMVAAAPSLDAGRLAIWQEYEDVMANAIAEERGDREGLASRVLAAMLITSYAAIARHVLSSRSHHVGKAMFLGVVDHVADSFKDFNQVKGSRSRGRSATMSPRERS